MLIVARSLISPRTGECIYVIEAQSGRSLDLIRTAATIIVQIDTFKIRQTDLLENGI